MKKSIKHLLFDSQVENGLTARREQMILALVVLACAVLIMVHHISQIGN